MDLSPSQVQAVREAQEVLVEAEIQFPQDKTPEEFIASLQQPQVFVGGADSPEDHVDLQYRPQPARIFSEYEISQKENKLTRKVVVHAIVDHPLGSIVEFPQSGDEGASAVAHRYRINPKNYIHPKDNIQYSLGDSKGGHPNIVCYLLRDVSTEKPVKCYQTKISCRSVKGCVFAANSLPMSAGISLVSSNASFIRSRDAQREVFEKTLAFFATIISRGCTLATEFIATTNSSVGPDLTDSIYESDESSLPYDIRANIKPKCNGKFRLIINSYNQPVLKCEHHRKGHRAHLFVRNLGEYDLNYLRALLENNQSAISALERAAKDAGYGPLATCEFTAVRREQKQLCPHWHRFSNGSLERGILQSLSSCPTRFEIYVPNDLERCPYILIVSRSPHSHSNPRPTRTPLTIITIFHSFLRDLGWRLADTTPRKLALDAGFMAALRKRLDWEGIQDPTLSDFHPSLGNLDHTARLIDELRKEYFPHGTGLQGALDLLERHKTLPKEEQYLRVVETISLPGQDTFQLIICMLPAMSELLMTTKRPTIDTSFKRADGFEEFEIEAWFPEVMKSVVCARAFISSQSAAAHLYFFKQIFAIAEADTGKPVQFRHIHGSGFETIGADAHKGQALGVGQFCVSLCADIVHTCNYSCNCSLNTLSPYEHLAHFYRLCTNHFERKIYNLGGEVSLEVQAAMYSLSSAYPLPDLEATIALIRNGGAKALAWMNDKQIGSPFAIPAIYRPASKIPLEIWQAAPATTNGNEQAHRNSNRDGIGLALLAALWRGHQYDVRAISSYSLMEGIGIHQRDQQPSYFRRAGRAVLRKVNVQKRKITSVDDELTETYRYLDQLRNSVEKHSRILENSCSASSSREAASRSLQELDSRRQHLENEAKALVERSSGAIPARDFSQEPPLFDFQLITHPSRLPVGSPLKNRQTKKSRLAASELSENTTATHTRLIPGAASEFQYAAPEIPRATGSVEAAGSRDPYFEQKPWEGAAASYGWPDNFNSSNSGSVLAPEPHMFDVFYVAQ